MTVSEYLYKKGYDYRVTSRPSGSNAVFNCPKCGDTEKKFAINLETGAFNCLRTNNCGWKGSFYEFQLWHNDQPKKLITDTDFKKPIKTYIKPEKEDRELSEGIYL